MKPVPVAVVYRMVYNKRPLLSRKLKYKDKSYKFAAYDITKADFAKIKRVEGKASFTLGVVQQGAEMFEINASSIDMVELKSTILENPIVGVMSVVKGKTSDTLEPKYVAATAIAFEDIDDFDKAKLAALKTVVTNKSVRDAQRTKVYKWEAQFFNRLFRSDGNWKRTKPAKLKEIATKILTHFKIPLDKVYLDTKATKSATRLGVTKTFRDDISSENPSFNIVHIHDATIDTLIHELAHVIAWHKYSKGEAAGHGAEFCGIYANILGLFSVFTEATVIASMTKAGLKVKKYQQATTEVEEI